jgi:nucleoside-diphosphate-sugar epimerase
MKKKTIIVTGASGFIGKFLIKELIKNKNNFVVGVYYKSNYHKLKKEFRDKVKWLKVNLVKDNLNKILPNADVVYHLSGYYPVSSSAHEADTLKKINLLATKRLAATCKYLNIKQFIFISSIAACEASKDLIINEDNGYPITIYGRIKKKAETELFNISKGHYNLTVLRPTSIFGENHKGTIYQIAKIIKKRMFVKFGRNTCYVNFYYVKDFVDLLVKIKLKKIFFNQIFIVADKPLKLETLVYVIQKTLKLKKKLNYFPLFTGYVVAFFFELISLFNKKYLLFSTKKLNKLNNKVIYSNKKISKLTTFKYRHGVIAGIIRSINWYKKTNLL